MVCDGCSSSGPADDIEEALLLGSRIVVLSERPANTLRAIAIEKPYPRRRDDAGLIALRRVVLSALGLEQGQ